MVAGEKHSYIIIKVKLCSNDELTDDQKARGVTCAAKDDIDKWRSDKLVVPISMQNEKDFSRNGATFQYDKWHQSIKLKKGFYTDAGYRWRYNLY